MTEITGQRPAPSRGRQAFQWLSLLAVVAIPLAAIVWLAAPRATCACTPTAGLPASPVSGVVVGVDSAGLGQVHGFTLRVDGGAELELQLGALENAAQFSPSHITEHLATSERIRVFYRIENGVPTVHRVEDALP